MDDKPFSLDQDPYHFALSVFGNRWKPFLIRAVGFDGRTRFNKFTKQIPISEKVLAENLRELEEDGVIRRFVYPEVPPRVEYELTDLGKSVCDVLSVIYDWGWREMKRRGLPVDPLGEMWHGYREPDPELMQEPYKKGKK